MNKTQSIVGAALLLLPVTMAITAVHAQKPSLPLPPPLFIIPTTSAFHEIPTDQWVYIDLDRVRYSERYRTPVYPDYTGSHRAYTREDFGRLVAGELRAMDTTLEQELRADPPVWRAMCRLVQEFSPELTRQNVDVTAVLNRLLRSGKNLPVNRADYPFGDVPANHWAFKSVERLRNTGILVGYSDSRFQTDTLPLPLRTLTPLPPLPQAGRGGVCRHSGICKAQRLVFYKVRSEAADAHLFRLPLFRLRERGRGGEGLLRTGPGEGSPTKTGQYPAQKATESVFIT